VYTLLFIIAIIIVIISAVQFTNNNRQEQEEKINGHLKQLYPNFAKALKSLYGDKVLIYADNNRALCYKIFVMYNNRKVGEMYFTLSVTENRNYVIQVYEGYDKKRIISEKYYLQGKDDLPVSKYKNIFAQITSKMIANSIYLNSTTGINLDLFDSNERKWRSFLSIPNIPIEFKLIIEEFFIKDEIDFTKYLENDKANDIINEFGSLESWQTTKSLSLYDDIAHQVIKCSPTFLKYYTDDSNRISIIPDWFYIAYPDVAFWIIDKLDDLVNEISQREHEFVGENDQPNLFFFRTMIEKYKFQGYLLECST